MIRAENSVVIDRPLEEVWKFMSDFGNVPKWNTRVLEVRQTPEGPIGMGTNFQFTTRFLGQRITDLRITEWEPTRKFAFESTSRVLKGSKASYAMEPAEGKTRLTVAGEVELRGFWRLIEPIMMRMAKRYGRADLATVKHLLEPRTEGSN